jgi:phospholipid/cholesterol/gamma-HCH transport system substrate-binding protein
MRESLFETLVGLAVVVVAAIFLTFSLQQRSEAQPKDSYALSAKFNRVDGIAVGSDVRLAGKKVGVVSAIDLDPKTYKAVVTFTLPKTVTVAGKAEPLQIPDDTTAQILTDGLLGGSYLGLMVGGSFDYLKPGGQVEFTRGSVDLLTVLSEFASNAGGNSSDKSATNGTGGASIPEAPQ